MMEIAVNYDKLQKPSLVDLATSVWHLCTAQFKKNYRMCVCYYFKIITAYLQIVQGTSAYYSLVKPS